METISSSNATTLNSSVKLISRADRLPSRRRYSSTAAPVRVTRLSTFASITRPTYKYMAG